MKPLTDNQFNAVARRNWVVIPQTNAESGILSGYAFMNKSILNKHLILYVTDELNFGTEDAAAIIQQYADGFDVQDYAENYGEKEATELDLIDAENAKQMILELAVLLKYTI